MDRGWGQEISNMDKRVINPLAKHRILGIYSVSLFLFVVVFKNKTSILLLYDVS